jgi:hypothetical protein
MYSGSLKVTDCAAVRQHPMEQGASEPQFVTDRRASNVPWALVPWAS